MLIRCDNANNDANYKINICIPSLLPAASSHQMNKYTEKKAKKVTKESIKIHKLSNMRVFREKLLSNRPKNAITLIYFYVLVVGIWLEIYQNRTAAFSHKKFNFTEDYQKRRKKSHVRQFFNRLDWSGKSILTVSIVELLTISPKKKPVDISHEK